MKIQDTNIGGLAFPDAAKTGATQGVRPGGDTSRAAQANRSSDQVSLSDFASKISGQLDANAAQRAERVGRLAASYQAGTYNPDPAAVSRKIVEASIGPMSELR